MFVANTAASYVGKWLFRVKDGSVKDMLLFACCPLYLSPSGRETIPGEASGKALLPSFVLDKLKELNRAIETSEPIGFAVNLQLAIMLKERMKQNSDSYS